MCAIVVATEAVASIGFDLYGFAQAVILGILGVYILCTSATSSVGHPQWQCFSHIPANIQRQGHDRCHCNHIFFLLIIFNNTSQSSPDHRCHRLHCHRQAKSPSPAARTTNTWAFVAARTTNICAVAARTTNICAFVAARTTNILPSSLPGLPTPAPSSLP